jgi:adenine/guanine/hypoxanthine permease
LSLKTNWTVVLLRESIATIARDFQAREADVDLTLAPTYFRSFLKCLYGASLNWLNLFFGLQRSGTTPSREVVAGLTTFTTMSYIIVVNPAILSTAGIPEGPCFVATILVAVAGCYLMAFCANRPFAVAPYMGENAFVAFTVCKMLGFAWQTALAAIFIAGIAFILLTILRLRQWVVEGVPDSLRFSFATGIGLFFTFIGLNQTGLVVLGVPGAPVRAGHLTSPPALVAMFGFLLLAVLTIRKVPGAILIGIVVTALPAFIAGTASPPKHLLSMPPSVAPILWQLDFRGALTWRAFPVVLTIFIMACVDTMGTLIGLSAHAGFLDESGQLPQIERQCWSMLLPPVFHQLLALPPRALSSSPPPGSKQGEERALLSSRQERVSC